MHKIEIFVHNVDTQNDYVCIFRRTYRTDASVISDFAYFKKHYADLPGDFSVECDTIVACDCGKLIFKQDAVKDSHVTGEFCSVDCAHAAYDSAAMFELVITRFVETSSLLRIG